MVVMDTAWVLVRLVTGTAVPDLWTMDVMSPAHNTVDSWLNITLYQAHGAGVPMAVSRVSKSICDGTESSLRQFCTDTSMDR